MSNPCYLLPPEIISSRDSKSLHAPDLAAQVVWRSSESSFTHRRIEGGTREQRQFLALPRAAREVEREGKRKGKGSGRGRGKAEGREEKE